MEIDTCLPTIFRVEPNIITHTISTMHSRSRKLVFPLLSILQIQLSKLCTTQLLKNQMNYSSRKIAIQNRNSMHTA
jgi:hypothetical protein